MFYRAGFRKEALPTSVLTRTGLWLMCFHQTSWFKGFTPVWCATVESLVELLSAMIRAKWKHRELGPTIFILVFLSMTFLIFRPTNHSGLILKHMWWNWIPSSGTLGLHANHNFGNGGSESVSLLGVFYLSRRVVSSVRDWRKCEAAVEGCWRRPFPLQPSSLCWM